MDRPAGVDYTSQDRIGRLSACGGIAADEARQSLEHPGQQDRLGLNFAPAEPDAGPVRVTCPSLAALTADIGKRLAGNQGFTVATLNLDHIVKLRADPGFRAAYGRHSHVVADGNPVVWLTRLSGGLADLVPGSDLVDPICRLAAEMAAPVGLFGSDRPSLEQARARLLSRHPGLDICAAIAPSANFDPFGREAEAVIDRMKASPARMWFLALGAPKQEIFAIRAAEQLPECGFLSVGAGIDFIAGTQKRAPRWVRKAKAEWIWRMATDPARLAPRYLKCAAALPGLSMSALRARRTAPAAGGAQ